VKSPYWLLLPVIAIAAIILLGGGDKSQAVLHKSTYTFISGPEKSVEKLERLYDIDMLMIKVANLAQREIIHANINILDGWDFIDTCGKTANACFASPNHIYLEAGWSISNMTGLSLAHEMAHLYYPTNQLAADQISCAIFPDFEKCENVRPER